MTRFKFGKWEVGEADFIGRHVKKEGREIRMDQEKYIVEKVEPVHLSKGKIQQGRSAQRGGVQELQEHAVQGKLVGASDAP